MFRLLVRGLSKGACQHENHLSSVFWGWDTIAPHYRVRLCPPLWFSIYYKEIIRLKAIIVVVITRTKAVIMQMGDCQNYGPFLGPLN